MDQNVDELFGMASFAITSFGVVYCLLQTEFPPVSRSFALFLTAVSVANAPDAFYRVIETALGNHAPTADLLVWLSSSLFLAPLFWVYVVTLTSRSQRPPVRLRMHLALPAFAVLTSLLILLSPPDVRASLTNGDNLPSSPWWVALVLWTLLLQLAVYPQMAIYLVLIVRRMIRYRQVLRAVYATTERYELRWITAIGILSALYWGAGALSLATALDPDRTAVPDNLIAMGSLFSITLVVALTLWGMRQHPPLVPEAGTEALSVPGDGQHFEPHGDRYAKSALSGEASARIARKLRAAMEQDHLHRDPNLSLWSLARHIGASPNYISQTLNEVIGESFFDFVNGYRVTDAMERLSATDDTVLTVTYDVGFNARSSFYKAFKRVTGQTPTGYRKSLSFPDGMDDVTP